jgi:hypothetical protein
MNTFVKHLNFCVYHIYYYVPNLRTPTFCQHRGVTEGEWGPGPQKNKNFKYKKTDFLGST